MVSLGYGYMCTHVRLLIHGDPQKDSHDVCPNNENYVDPFTLIMR